MPQARRRLLWHCTAFAAAVFTLASPASHAAKSPASVKNADHLVATGNPKATEIELRNAIQESPQDPLLRSQLARVYLQLGDPISAEREARAARDRNGKEADYLPVLLELDDAAGQIRRPGRSGQTGQSRSGARKQSAIGARHRGGRPP